MFNIKTYNNISPCGLDQFDPASFVVGPDVTEPHAYLLRSHKLHDHEFPASLNAVARAGAGVNNIPIDLLTHKGVVVFNTPGANANAVKELVAAALFLDWVHIDCIGYCQFIVAVHDGQRVMDNISSVVVVHHSLLIICSCP